MKVPPTAVDGSFDCFKGIVKEINRDEVVLTEVVEERCIKYGTAAQPRSLMQQQRDLVHVPLTGVDLNSIWALPPAKDAAAAKSSSTPSAANLPSNGAGAVSSPPLPETPVRFDAPPAAGAALR